jgi:integrase
VIPARLTAVEISLRGLHHARVGVTAKTLANHKSNIRAALRWFGKQHEMPRRGIKLSADWAAFRDKFDRPARDRLSSLMRYGSARSIGPGSINDQIFGDYWRYRAETTALPTNDGARRLVARAWNACASAIDRWPLQRLTEPPIKPKGDPPWKDFPEGLQKDVDAHFARLSKPHRTFSGKRIRPCKPSTIQNGRVEVMAVARMAVRLGVPINSLTSLAALLHPDVVERVIEGYWQKNGNEPKVFTIDLGWKLLRIARETGCLEQAAIERLDDIRAVLEDYRRSGLTQKNLQLVRQVLTEGIWTEVVLLPSVLMRQARWAKDHAPIKAAVTAQLAAAIAILTFAPVRISNLVDIELDKNLTKPGGLITPYWLVFPDYDVKNRVDLNFQFDQTLTDLIDEYVHEFRPALLRGANCAWLFPGEGGDPKTRRTLGPQMTARIKKAVGLRITPHQFRHAAAAIYLKHRPGDYETVRRLLGHRNIQTTVSFYCGLQTTQATQEFGKIIRQRIKFDSVV